MCNLNTKYESESAIRKDSGGETNGSAGMRKKKFQGKIVYASGGFIAFHIKRIRKNGSGSVNRKDKKSSRVSCD